MKYENASDILPDPLLRELQKYASGKVVYIPRDQRRKGWGADNGTKQYYEQRNESIRRKRQENQSIASLADEYCLSSETIRKILYKKK